MTDWQNKVSEFKQQIPFVGLSQHNHTISEHRQVWEAANRRRVEKLCLSAPLYSRPSFKTGGKKEKKSKLPYLRHVITHMGKQTEQYSEAFSCSTSPQSLSGTKSIPNINTQRASRWYSPKIRNRKQCFLPGQSLLIYSSFRLCDLEG